ncbi:MAG: hypothetical protein E6R03_09020 [Hyphomicrobiaceae bacterium]|nr:MAG: hypothetical protein E6R03_09020 [Hyphomicrobiaceae bacterium]
MKVTEKKLPLVQFKHLNPGYCFNWNDQYFLKTSWVEKSGFTSNAACMLDGCHMIFSDDEQVIYYTHCTLSREES